MESLSSMMIAFSSNIINVIVIPDKRVNTREN